MDTNLNIVNNRTHYFEFDLVVEGLDDADAKVCFVILSQPFDMTFHCKRVGDNKWGLELPKLAFIEPTTYQVKITAVIDGYFFEAHRGTINITKSADVYVKTEDTKMKVESRKEEPKKPQPAPAPTTVKEQRVVKPAANEGDQVTRDQVREIVSRLKASETQPLTEETKPVENKKKPVVSKKVETPKDDPLAEARKTAQKLFNEGKVKHSPQGKSDDKVKQIISEYNKEKQQQKQREREKQRRLAEEAKKKEALELVANAKSKQPQPVSEEVEVNEKDAKAKAVLESISKKPETAEQAQPTVKFKKSGTVVK